VALLQWDEKFSVGIPELDREHQQLVAMINKLHDAMKSGQGKGTLPQVINDLADYALKHFSHEEQLMEKCGYPDLARHKTAHAEFALQVTGYIDQVNNGTLQAMALMKVLQEWLVSHIMQVDKNYGPFITTAKT
jgi:hemerythrin